MLIWEAVKDRDSVGSESLGHKIIGALEIIDMKNYSCNKCLILVIFLAALTILSCQSAYCSPPCIAMDLNKSFGGSYDDELYSIQPTSDAGYIATGRTKSYGENDYDLYLIKTDKSGNILWQKNYGGAREDEGYSVEETADGGYIVAGRTRSYGSGMYDVWLVMVDPSGEKTWDKTFGGALDDEASSIKKTSDGGFIIAGSTKSYGSGMYDLWLIRIDRFGSKLWDKTFGGAGDDMGDSIQVIGDEGFVVAGTTASWGNGDVDLLLMKIDSNGNELWTKTFGGEGSERNPWSRGWQVLKTADGGYAMLGSTNSFGSGGYDIWFVKTDANGDKIIDRVYGGTYDEEGGSLVVTAEGDHILIGSTNSFGSGGYDAWLILADQNGEKIWDQTFGSKLDDKGYSVIQTDDGSALFAGKMKPYIAPPPRRIKGCCDDGQPGEAPTYYDGWLVGIRSAHPIIELQPADYAACEGQKAILNVSASGNEPILYQWLKDGSQIAGATGDSYIIPAASVADVGSYQVRVSNACGSVDSRPAVLVINSKPLAEIEPFYGIACAGSEVVLNATASGTEPLTYQWRKNGVDIAGANTNRYLISDLQQADGGDYTLSVSNICGVAESGPVHIAVRSRPEILRQPIGQTVCAGSSVSFEVQVAGNESYTYQWQKDGRNITAANSAQLSISAAGANDQGNYSVIISSDLCGSIQSDQAELRIRSMPMVTELLQPASQLACEGSEVTLAANVNGSDPLAFQWMKDGVQIPGASLASYLIKSANGNDSGSYSLIVSNDCGQVESNASYLEILAGPEILLQPESQMVCEGAAATFAVQAESSEPLSYQWFKDGVQIPGATADAYTIPATNLNDTGSYTVQVANNCSQIESEASSLDIIASPMILKQPASQKTCQGSPATFTVQAESSEPLSYQWFKDGVPIPGATSDAYTIPAANLSDPGSYTVTVANNCRQIESEAASLDVVAWPAILKQPASQKACQGSPATFSVQAESSEPLSYQWSKDGVQIPGATADAYTIPAANLSDLGSYAVTVANNCRQIESDMASLDVIASPTILKQPASQKTCQGRAATFSVQAESSESLRYQWFKDGVQIPGATADAYTIPAASLSDPGIYTVTAANNCRQIESVAASLEVISLPEIYLQPASQKACHDAPVTFSVKASSNEPLEYQWLKDGTEIPGANSEEYTIPVASLNHTGSFSVQIRNSCGQIESGAAVLDIIAEPVILAQPTSQLVCPGEMAIFSVQVESNEPLQYQWFKNGIEIPGALSDTYAIPAANFSDMGSYSVLAANDCGQIESEAANLELISLPEISRQPASLKTCQGRAATFSVQAESSHPLSYQWFKDGMEIPGATKDVYVIDQADLNHTGSYFVQVANNCRQIESEAAYLEIIELPRILVPPASQRICPGAAVTFAVQADSREPLSYQWFKDGIEIYEATRDVYTIPATSSFDTGNYTVMVKNSCGLIESEAAHLEIIQSPEILAPPVSKRVCQGDAPSFSVQAESSEKLDYQWLKDGNIIQGATADAYTIPAAALGDMASYSVQISDGCNLIKSESANLETIIAPKISLQPASQVVCQGTEAKFTVEAISNDPLSYQWFKDGVKIPGATAETYSIQKANPGDKGIYQVQVANRCGQIESEAANLDVIALPEILLPPVSQKVCEGSTVKFTVMAKSSQPLRYQWIKGGRTIRGANTEELTISDVSIEDMGEYRVAISNGCGFIDSNAVSLIVERPPGIVDIEPDCLIADAGESVAFVIKGTANEADSYQWEKNGEIIPGEVSPSLIILNSSTSDSGGYRLTVSNSCGSKKSGMSVLRVVEDSKEIDPCQNPLSPCCNSSQKGR